MIRETGDALRILTTEVLTQIGQTVLQATVMTALMSALQWPIGSFLPRIVRPLADDHCSVDETWLSDR
jgi:hypothetical protein